MSNLPGFSKVGGVTKFSELVVDQTFDEAMHHLNQKAEDKEEFQWNFRGLATEMKYRNTESSEERDAYCSLSSAIDGKDMGYIFNIATKYSNENEGYSMYSELGINSEMGIRNRLKVTDDSMGSGEYISQITSFGFDFQNDAEVYSQEAFNEFSSTSIPLRILFYGDGLSISKYSYTLDENQNLQKRLIPLLNMNENSLDHYNQIIRENGASINGVPRNSVYLIHFTGEGNEKYYYDADYDALKEEEEEEVGDKKYALYHYSTDSQSNPSLELVQIRGIPTYPLDSEVQFHLSDTGEWMTLTDISGLYNDPVLGLIPEIPTSVQEIHYYILNYDDTFGTGMGEVYLDAMENLTSISNSFLGTTSGTIYVTETQLQKLLTDQWIKLVEGTSDEYVMSENPKVLVKLAPIDEIVVGE